MAGSPTQVSRTAPNPTAIPHLYRLFFLTLEPIATLTGAYYAALAQQSYMHLTLPSSSTPSLAGGISPRESTVLYQLANLYLAFALNEALVLRATSDVRVWRVLLFGLLLADLGHLASVRGAMGWGVYWRVWEWNLMYWGNVGFVYCGAVMRLCFLFGVGFGEGKGKVR